MQGYIRSKNKYWLFLLSCGAKRARYAKPKRKRAGSLVESNCDRVPSGLAGRGMERSTYLQFGLVPFIYLFIFRLSQVLNVARAEAYETEKRSGKFVRRQEKAA